MEDLQMLKKNWIYKRGNIYLADLGTPAGSVQGGVRPVINIQNNTGSFFGPTLIVIPLTTELKKLNQPTHYVLQKQRGLEQISMSESGQPVTINKTQVIKYLGKTDQAHMRKIDDCLRISLHLNPEGTTVVTKPVLKGQDENGKNIWEDQRTKVPNQELKSMVEAYKTRTPQARDQKAAEPRESAREKLDALVKDTASKLTPEKTPKAKSKTKKGPEL